ncbi:hypothetical protein NKG05_25375 [Oerskovia sp. M15]
MARDAAAQRAVLLIAFQIFVVYVASAMYKIQGGMWQHGTAIYYVFQLDEFSTWPQVTEVVSRSGCSSRSSATPPSSSSCSSRSCSCAAGPASSPSSRSPACTSGSASSWDSCTSR